MKLLFWRRPDFPRATLRASLRQRWQAPKPAAMRKYTHDAPQKLAGGRRRSVPVYLTAAAARARRAAKRPLWGDAERTLFAQMEAAA